MSKSRNLFVLTLAMAGLIASTAVAEENVKIAALVYRIIPPLSGEGNLENAIDLEPELCVGPEMVPAPFHETSYFQKASIRLADGGVLTLENDDILLNGEKLGSESNRNKKIIDVLTCPLIMMKKNQQGTIEMYSEPEVQYFERTAEGLFELKTIEKQLGIQLKIETSEIEPSLVAVRVEVEISSVEKRQPLEAVRLDVGMPIISSRAASVNWTVGSPSPWMLLGRDSEGYLLVIRFRSEMAE